MCDRDGGVGYRNSQTGRSMVAQRTLSSFFDIVDLNDHTLPGHLQCVDEAELEQNPSGCESSKG
eukprot:scaffold64549_cov33-Tisochrysis_lutea.AAC.2